MFQTTHTRLAIVGRHEIILNGQIISYMLKRSARAKYVRLEVKRETGLTVVVPNSYKIGQLPSFLEAKRSWILRYLAKYSKVKPLSAERELESGDTIPYRGRDLEVVKQQNCKKAEGVRLKQNKLIVSLGLENNRLDLALERWYRIQAAKLIKERADTLSARLGLTYNRITIRGQKTRWGSCSCKGNLSFNWRLMMAPEPVIDYVIIHELAHIKEMNHTKRFWALVAECCPLWREHRKWLKDHEAEMAAKLSL